MKERPMPSFAPALDSDDIDPALKAKAAARSSWVSVAVNASLSGSGPYHPVCAQV
ncbi:hypothetical protein [Novosphingobium rosa]|uniref:hypothetical protein n=1 Tax=Novosphingobium rosa TaxID=76978 RepID=UPI000A50B17B|nr:hypothetical protein [Novosphingobium rosa]